MKTMQKVFVLLLAAVLIISLGVTAFADDPSYTISITGFAGQTYNAYKIFDVTSPTTGNIFSYTIDADDLWLPVVINYIGGYVKVGDAWYAVSDTNTVEGVTSANEGAVPVTTFSGNKGITLTRTSDGSHYVVTVNDATYQGLIGNFAAHLLENKPSGVLGTSTTADTDGSATITVFTPGYYLVDSTLGALCILNTTTSNVDVVEKNDEPTLKKHVQEDSTGDWVDTATADMNQNVNFKLTVTTGSDSSILAGNYVITDTLPAGMSYVGDVTEDGNHTVTSGLTVTTTSTESPTQWSSGYSATYLSNVLTITLNETALEALGDQATIEITYSAKLEQSVTPGTANTNTATMTYHGYTTAAVTATVKTFEIGSGFTKVDAADSSLMSGVKFVLSRTEGSETKYALLDGNSSDGYKLNSWVDLAYATSIVTSDAGTFTLQGLDAGSYLLTETETLAGYNLLTDTITVTVADDGDVKYSLTNGTATPNNTIIVENSTGSVLPSTGGIGTTIFTIVGITLMAGAAIVLITKKRMS